MQNRVFMLKALRQRAEMQAIHNFYVKYEKELRKIFDKNGQPLFRISTLKSLYDYLKGDLTNELQLILGMKSAKKIIETEIKMLDAFMEEYYERITS